MVAARFQAPIFSGQMAPRHRTGASRAASKNFIPLLDAIRAGSASGSCSRADDGQIRSREIVAGGQQGFATDRGQRVDGAISEVELRAMAHAFADAGKGTNGEFCLSRIEHRRFYAQLFEETVQLL